MTEIQVDYVNELDRLQTSNNDICGLKTNFAKAKYRDYRHLFILRTILKKKKTFYGGDKIFMAVERPEGP